MKRGVKKKEFEKLSAENIRKVISLLSADKPITKKEACSILNISYNTTRLNKIIEEFEEREQYEKTRRDQNRGKPATDFEIAEAATGYLRGQPISVIAKGMYRSPSFVKNLLTKIGVPEKDDAGIDVISEKFASEEFQPGEIVWSAQYHKIAKIESELNEEFISKNKGLGNTDYEKKYSSKCYSIYVIEDVDSSDSFFPGVETGGFKAYSLAYDLGKLEHLKQYGVDLERI